MWGFGWGSFAERGAAGATRPCFLVLRSLPCRLDETWRKGSGLSRSAGVGPRDGRTLSLSTGKGPSGAGEQRANGVGGERVCCACREGLDDGHRRDPGGSWVWFLSETTALQEAG